MKSYRQTTLCECGDHVWAPLLRGFVTLVDPGHESILRDHPWSVTSKGYVQTAIKGKTVKLHRMVVDAKLGELVDHRDHNKKDNRSRKLRTCDHFQSIKNRGPLGPLGLKGVSYNRNEKNFWARIGVNKTCRLIGKFATAAAAATAYDEAALRLHGEFALTNAMIASRKREGVPCQLAQ